MRNFEDYSWRDILTPEMERIFSAYHRNRALSSRPALLVVHPDKTSVVSVQPDWHLAALRLIEAVHIAGLTVIHSVPPETELRPEIPLRGGELICRRPTVSAFMFTDLEVLLTRTRSNGVVLCGAVMSGPLRATAVDAKSYGYATALAEDATGDEAGLLHKLALFDVAHKYADVMTTEEIAASLLAGETQT
jgi:nicotinamidase-related amidase